MLLRNEDGESLRKIIRMEERDGEVRRTRIADGKQGRRGRRGREGMGPRVEPLNPRASVVCACLLPANRWSRCRRHRTCETPIGAFRWEFLPTSRQSHTKIPVWGHGLQEKKQNKKQKRRQIYIKTWQNKKYYISLNYIKKSSGNCLATLFIT